MKRPALGVFLILWASYAFFWHARDWNTASRLMLTYSLVDAEAQSGSTASKTRPATARRSRVILTPTSCRDTHSSRRSPTPQSAT